MQAGILTKITYPTGGYTIFEYDAYKYIKTERIKKHKKHSYAIYAQGKGGYPTAPCKNKLQKNTFTIGNYTPIGGKLITYFTYASAGYANRSYVKFNGNNYEKIVRRDAVTGSTYPESRKTIDLTYKHGAIKILHRNTTYTLEGMEYGEGFQGAAGCPFLTARVEWKQFLGYEDKKTEITMGGLRIKSITQYDGKSPQYIAKKEFEYKKANRILPMNLNDYQVFRWNASEAFNNVLSSSPAYTLNNNGGPAIEYNNVTAYDKDAAGNIKGKIVSLYDPTPVYKIIGNGSAGSGSQFKLFLHPNYLGGLCAGLQIPRQLSDVLNTLKTFGYGNFRNFKVESWAGGRLKRKVVFKGNNAQGYVKIQSLSNRYKKVNQATIHRNIIHDAIIFPKISLDFHGGLCAKANGTFMYKKVGFSLGKKLLTQSIDSLFDSNGQNPMVTRKHFAYDNPYYFKTEEKMVDSYHQTLQKKTYYPNDKSKLSGLTTPASAAIDRLIQKHQIAIPLQEETYQSGVLYHKKRTNYQLWNTHSVPSSVEAAKEVLPLETKATYYRYDVKGNPTEFSKSKGSRTVYLWGYNYSQPIAKIENASYVEVVGALGKSSSDDLSYLQSYSETQIQTEIHKIRNKLSHAKVTTYTYIPLIGISTVTDDKGKTMSYQYDGFNRLKTIKDTDKKLLKKLSYHYKN